MSAAWLYGLLRVPDLAARLEASPVEGLAGPVQALDLGGIALAFSACDGQPVPQRRRFLKGHAQALEALMEHGPLLPFRFGHIARDLGRIERLIEASRAGIETEFATLAGKAEVGLKVEFDREAALARMLAEIPELARQRDRLMARGGGERMAQIELGRRVAETLESRRTAAQRALLRKLAPLAANHVLHSPEEDVQLLRAAFLLPQEGVEAFAAAVEEAAIACGFADTPPRIRLVHPTPPFHFVSLSLGDTPDSEVA